MKSYSTLLGSASVVAFALALSGAAHAADLPRRSAAPAAVVAAPLFTWTGFYAGVNAGYAFSNSGSSFTDPTYGTVTTSGSNGGFAGGGQVGFNYQLTPGSGFVVGVEADIQAIDLGGANGTAYVGTTPYYGVAPSLDYFGTVRGRVGYAFDRLLVYGTGGFAYGGGSANTTYGSVYPYTLPDNTFTGYAAGGGVEYAFTDTVSAKLEGLYVNLDRGAGGATVYDGATGAYYGAGPSSTEFGLVRAGLNFRFSTF